MIRLIFLFFISVLFSCSSQSEQRAWESMARSSFHDFLLWEDARMVNAIDFKGPVIKQRVENFEIDSSKIVFAWFYVHEIDTFWIYCEVDKRRIEDPNIHVSLNYDELGLHWEEWLSKDY